MNKIKVITLFSGIGSQEMALRNLGLDYEVVGISEIDKFAIKSYEAIFRQLFLKKHSKKQGIIAEQISLFQGVG